MSLLQSDKPEYLVCPPDYFEITQPLGEFSAINDHALEGYKIYSSDPRKFIVEARKQWDALIDCFIRAGIELVSLSPHKEMPYLVFAADGSVSINRTFERTATFVSRFSNEFRSRESEIHYEFIKDRFPQRRLIISPYHCEGSGDNIYDPFRDLFWSGYTPTPGREKAYSGRSDKKFHELLTSITCTEVVSLEVQRPFFHLDTTFAPLSRGHIVVYEHGMWTASFRELVEKGFIRYGLNPEDFLIKVDDSDASKYACNLVCKENTVIIPNCSKGLTSRIAAKGYDVVRCNVDNFIHAGGAIHCLINQINQRVSGRIPQLQYVP